MVGEGLPAGVDERFQAVFHHRPITDDGPHFLDFGGEAEAVDIADLPRREECGRNRHDFIPGGKNGHAGTAVNSHAANPQGRQHAHILRAQAPSPRQTIPHRAAISSPCLSTFSPGATALVTSMV